MEYKCQRLFRDARIFSIYEGTTQLQVVAAIRYVTNGTYLGIIKEMLEKEVAPEFQALKDRVAKMVEKYEDAINYVKAAGNNDPRDSHSSQCHRRFRLPAHLPRYGVLT